VSRPEPRTWSVSAARAYTCPRQWWLIYVAHAPQESGFDSIRGQVLHAGVAAGYSTHAVAVAEGRELVVAIRRSHVAVEHAVCKAAARLGHEEVDEAIDTAIECLNELCPEPGDEVLLVEQSMYIEVDGVPFSTGRMPYTAGTARWSCGTGSRIRSCPSAGSCPRIASSP
jgi:hypothetical protein